MSPLIYDLTAMSVSDVPARTVLALGCFDGVHRGHRAIADAAVCLAQKLGAVPGALTFNTPPAASLGAHGFRLLCTAEEKLRLLASTHLCFSGTLDFDEVRHLNARRFITEYLTAQYHAVGVVCGFNHTFGSDRSGNAETLAEYFGDTAVIVHALNDGGEPISSSRIRAMISSGDLSGAARLLGRPYSVTLPVVSGRHDGTRIGYPTLNQIPDPLLASPPPGVYVTLCRTADGDVRRSLTDVGYAPTLDKSSVFRYETHLPDADVSLCGTEVGIAFLERIRDEMNFGGTDALCAQIAADIEQANAYFISHPSASFE